jgi:hypothetical protein
MQNAECRKGGPPKATRPNLNLNLNTNGEERTEKCERPVLSSL